jgi:phosphopantothenoylcysteine decarboxylase/phosphopantothenate--cysteine ligase
MNQAMWANANTQNNMAKLEQTDVHIFGPDSGSQACGEVGEGRLLEVPDIVDAVIKLFPSGILSGKHVVITAGPTREAIDPVRYISNHSSGKQGYALAEAAIEAGAKVTLVSGPTQLAPVPRATMIHVTSADEMHNAVQACLRDCDIFIGVAAVADYRPKNITKQKIKKTAGDTVGGSTLTLELVENPDIVAAVARHEPKPFTVGFAAETQNLTEFARRKLNAKNLDLIVANDVSNQQIGFNSDNNATTLLWAEGELNLPMMSKSTLSRKIISLIAERI